MVGRLNIYPISEQEALIDLTTPYSESVAKNVLLLTGGESTVVDVFETVFFDFSRPTPEDGSMPRWILTNYVRMRTRTLSAPLICA